MGFGRERKGEKEINKIPIHKTLLMIVIYRKKKQNNPYLDHTLLNAKNPQNPGILYMVKKMNKSPYILNQATHLDQIILPISPSREILREISPPNFNFNYGIF